MTKVGSKIKDIREMLKLSQIELAKLYNKKSRQFIADIETNKTSPTFDFIMFLKGEFLSRTKYSNFDLDSLYNTNEPIESVYKSNKQIINDIAYYDEIDCSIKPNIINKIGHQTTGDLVIEWLLNSQQLPTFINNIATLNNLYGLQLYYKQNKGTSDNQSKLQTKIKKTKQEVYLSGIDLVDDLIKEG